jgi:hypothetical protein
MSKIPTVRAIRAALERVPGAIRDEPLAEDSGIGYDPATVVHCYDPQEDTREATLRADKVEQIGASASDSQSDSPNVIFEIPPSLTDADVWNVLGNIGKDLKGLAQVWGIDAYGWSPIVRQPEPVVKV